MLRIALSFVFIFFVLVIPQKTYSSDILKINEFVAHPSTGNSEWIEFYNPSNIDLSNYWLDDDINFAEDIGSPKKPLVGWVDGEIYDYFNASSFLNNSGDFVVIFTSDGNIVDQYEYTDDPGVDVVIGRSPDGDGQFVKLSTPTKGGVNSGELPTATSTVMASATPTRTPTPTKVPTPTKIPTVTKSPTVTKAPIRSASFGLTQDKGSGQAPSASKFSSAKKNIMSPTKKIELANADSSKDASVEAMPTAILGASTSLSPEKSKENKKKILIDAAKQDNSVIIFMVVGAVFLIACGILVYRKIRSSYE